MQGSAGTNEVIAGISEAQIGNWFFQINTDTWHTWVDKIITSGQMTQTPWYCYYFVFANNYKIY